MDRNQELWYDKGYDDGHEVGYDKAKAEERKKILDIVEELYGEIWTEFAHGEPNRIRFYKTGHQQAVLDFYSKLKTRIGGSDD